LINAGRFTETIQSAIYFPKGALTMTLTKTDIVDSVNARIGFTREKTVETVETLLEIIKSTLESGEEEILISGFGKFCVRDKKKRRGRNPAIGDDMVLRPRRVVTFKCSGKLKKKINLKLRMSG